MASGFICEIPGSFASRALFYATAEGDTTATIAYRGVIKNNGSRTVTGVVIAGVNGVNWITQETNSTNDYAYSYGNYGNNTLTINKTHETQYIEAYCSDNVATIVRGTIAIGPKTSYSITYNVGSGSGAPAQQTKWYGENLTLSNTVPTYTGYTFKGWATTNGGAVVYNPGDTYSTNAGATLYAVWERTTYTVTYDANSGINTPSPQIKTHGTNLVLTSTVPTKTGYKCIGWATSTAHASAGTVDYAIGGIYSTESDVMLYAVWELPYTKPVISNVIIERCQSDGTVDDEGSYAKISFTWSVYRSSDSRYYGGSSAPYSSNAPSSCTVQVGSVSQSVSLGSGASGSASQVLGGSFSTDSSYLVTISLTDSQQAVTPHTTIWNYDRLPMTLYPMDYNETATAVGFFKAAPDNGDGAYFGKDVIASKDIFLDLNSNAASGVDHDIIQAITAFGWTGLLT